MNETPAMLGASRAVVFSKRAVLGTTEDPQDAGRNLGLLRSGWERRPVGGRRHSVDACEAGRERAHTAKPDRKADAGDPAISAAEQRRGTLQPPGEQVGVRRLAEGSTEFAAEVGPREPGGAGQVV